MTTKKTTRPARRQQNPNRSRARAWKPVFLRVLDEQRSVTLAAEAAGVHLSTVYEARRTDAAFGEAWAGVETKLTESLEREAVRRAYDGWDEPVFQKGEQVGVVRKYSDPLLMFLLRGRRPDVYRDRTELTGPGGGPIQLVALSELARQAELEEGK